MADAPVGLAQTIALDLKGSWWSRFWRSRRGYQAFAEDFANLIYEETAPIPETLRAEYVDAYCTVLERALDAWNEAEHLTVKVAQHTGDPYFPNFTLTTRAVQAHLNGGEASLKACFDRLLRTECAVS